jgi:hypothetical protein
MSTRPRDVPIGEWLTRVFLLVSPAAQLPGKKIVIRIWQIVGPLSWQALLLSWCTDAPVNSDSLLAPDRKGTPCSLALVVGYKYLGTYLLTQT